MEYFVLASGSKGNCTVVRSGNEFIVIDCGTSKRYLKNSFEKIGLNYLEAEALLVTHEHSDHIKQVEMFDPIPVYSPCEIRSIRDERPVEPLEEFEVGCFHILPIPLSHDTRDTVGYIISDGKETLVSVTDTGYVSHNNKELIKNADYYIFESNYDTVMLMSSARPPYLKSRIISDSGHLSNEQSAEILADVIGPRTREIVLAHISQECNTRDIAYQNLIDTFESYNIDPRSYRIHAAGQYEIYQGGK
ncbi:MAG: MBL fold metallo-hydrolase [Erysipelotrichaceae bacterium]|nr:MBL fold metallo-hydrolase [Erysipelotrichaceae bacterium]